MRDAKNARLRARLFTQADLRAITRTRCGALAAAVKHCQPCVVDEAAAHAAPSRYAAESETPRRIGGVLLVVSEAQALFRAAV